MSLIKVTPDMLRARAVNVRKDRGEHDTCIARISNTINGLSDVWQGEAQNSFVERFRSMEPTFKQFSQLLEDYSTLMDKAANQLQETDVALKTTISSF